LKRGTAALIVDSDSNGSGSTHVVQPSNVGLRTFKLAATRAIRQDKGRAKCGQRGCAACIYVDGDPRWNGTFDSDAAVYTRYGSVH